MTFYELVRLVAVPFLPALHCRVMQDLRRLIKSGESNRPSLLDVGGRSSPYTIGLAAAITVLDLPSDRRTRLGITDEILNKLTMKRSNVINVVLEDMTKSDLPSDNFDGAICVEVLEHVKDKDAFLGNIRRVLKKGGWLYLTTPNYDYRKDLKTDGEIEIKFYEKRELEILLKRYFSEVSIRYGIKCGKHRGIGLKSPSSHAPLETLSIMANNLISNFESLSWSGSRRSAHLFAIAKKI